MKDRPSSVCFQQLCQSFSGLQVITESLFIRPINPVCIPVCLISPSYSSLSFFSFSKRPPVVPSRHTSCLFHQGSYYLHPHAFFLYIDIFMGLFLLHTFHPSVQHGGFWDICLKRHLWRKTRHSFPKSAVCCSVSTISTETHSSQKLSGWCSTALMKSTKASPWIQQN